MATNPRTISTDINKLLSKAKIALMAKPDTAFFSTILLSLKFIWDNTQKTAWVDGLRMGFNPDFFMSCTPDQRLFVLVHECSHMALMHIERGVGKVKPIWYRACDHVINLDLQARGYTMFDWVLKDARFTGMSTDQVYKILLAEHEANPGNPLPEIGMEDLREPDPNMDPAEYKRAVDDILIRAMVQSKISGAKPGAIPGDVEMYLDKLLNPKLSWQTILRKWLTELNKSGYSWKRPNRRFYPDHYLPSRWGEGGMSDFSAFVDISGSETDEDFHRFISELGGILRMMRPKKIELGQFDTTLKPVVTVKNVQELEKVEFHGRGGTIITEVLDHIEKTQPKVAMIFTDGGFHMDRQAIKGKTNILWMIHDNESWDAPFGKVIHYNTHD